VVIGYEDPTQLKLISVGSGGAAAVSEYLVEGECRYALIRNAFLHVEPGKEINTIKFIYVYYRSDSLPMKYKMKIGLYEKQISDLLSPYHTDLQISSTKEISEEIITKKLQKISGTATFQISEKKEKDATNMHVGSAGYIGGKALSTKPEAKATGGSVVGGAPLSFADEAEPSKSIGDVRSDSTATNWCLFGYADAKDKKSLVLKGSGAGGLEEFKGALEKDNVNYGLVRLIELIDGKTQAGNYSFTCLFQILYNVCLTLALILLCVFSFTQFYSEILLHHVHPPRC
jgi:hypothetical protein